jgi:hypothetical protein
MHGTTSEYLTTRLNGTGEAGKGTGIGKDRERGVYKVCNPERGHRGRPGNCSNDSPGRRIGHHNLLEKYNHDSPGPRNDWASRQSGRRNTRRVVPNPERRKNKKRGDRSGTRETVNEKIETDR